MDPDKAKRPRISHACDICRKKKIKCDGRRPQCSHCASAGKICTYTETVRKPRKTKTKKGHVKELENRLNKIEDMLEVLLDKQSSKKESAETEIGVGSFDKTELDQEGSDEAVSSSDESSDNHDDSSSDDSSDHPNEAPFLHPTMFHFKTTGQKASQSLDRYTITAMKAGTVYMGNPIFGVFSKNGQTWIDKKSGCKGLGDHLAKTVRTVHENFQNNSRPLIDRAGNDLVPLDKATVDILLHLYEKAPLLWTTIIPLKQFKKMIDAEFDLEYQKTLDYSSLNGFSELACIYGMVCLAFGVLGCSESYQTQYGISLEKIRSTVTEYSASAANCLMKLELGHVPSFTSLQACLCLALHFTENGNGQPAMFCIESCRRLVFALGLNRKESLVGFSQEEQDHRLVLFWLTYILNCDIAIKRGQPIAMSMRDITVPYVSYPSNQYVLDFCAKYTVTLAAQLSHIAVQSMEKLYPAINEPPNAIAKIVLDLDRQLESWRISLPESIRPSVDGFSPYLGDKLISTSLEVFRRDPFDPSVTATMSLLYLHCNYYMVLCDIHRIYAQYTYSMKFPKKKKSPGANCTSGSSSGANTPSNLKKSDQKRLSQSTEISLSASRSTLKLLFNFSFWGNCFLFGSVPFISHALITLFINILMDPHHDKAEEDIQLMYQAFAVGSGNGSVLRALASLWETLARVADQSVHNSPLQNGSSPASIMKSGNLPIKRKLSQNGFAAVQSDQPSPASLLNLENGLVNGAEITDANDFYGNFSEDALLNPANTSDLFQLSSYLFSIDQPDHWLGR